MNLKLISEDNLKIGVKKALDNSHQLIQEGRLLFELGFYSRAFSLFQFANEEIGKAVMIFNYLVFKKSGKSIDVEKINKQLTQHQAKHRYSSGIFFAALAISYSEQSVGKKEILKEAVKKIKSAKFFDDYKNSSLYVDVVNYEFKRPDEVITKELVSEIMWAAENNFFLYSKNIDERLGSIEDIAQRLKDNPVDFDFDQTFWEDLNEIIK